MVSQKHHETAYLWIACLGVTLLYKLFVPNGRAKLSDWRLAYGHFNLEIGDTAAHERRLGHDRRLGFVVR